MSTTPRKPGRATFDSANTRDRVARILAALETPRTFEQLRTAVPMSARSMTNYIGHLKREHLVYTRTFVKIDAHHLPIYALGDRPDAVKPCMPDKVKWAAHRARIKADPERSLARTRVEQLRWLAKKPRPAATWFGALL